MKKYFIDQISSSKDILKALRNSASLAAFFALLFTLSSAVSLSEGNAYKIIWVAVGLLMLFSQTGLVWAAHSRLKNTTTDGNEK